MTTTACRICEAPTTSAGTVYGKYSRRDYLLARCPDCRFSFVIDPFLGDPYDDAYYDGKGADPLVDYGFELEHPDLTVRRYEWEGVSRVVETLMGGISGLRWLDYGCGNAGLVRHLREVESVDAIGFEEGAIAARARAREIPVLDRAALATLTGSFDVVTAIEVLEHTIDPVTELRSMRSLLRTGGLLFLTTGNAAPYAARLAEWRYVVPEIHISFFEPYTLERALALAGFRSDHPRLGPGFDDILTFKVLKNLRVRKRSILTGLVPHRIVGKIANGRTRLADQPVGWAT